VSTQYNYLINVRFPSMCHNSKGAATLYWHLWMPSLWRISSASRSVCCNVSLTCHCCTTTPHMGTCASSKKSEKYCFQLITMKLFLSMPRRLLKRG